jgi:hypothetical protein
VASAQRQADCTPTVVAHRTITLELETRASANGSPHGRLGAMPYT